MKKSALVAVTVVLSLLQTAGGQSAGEILKSSGVRGGLVVHLGCGDGKLTSELRANDSYIVHGLDANAANIAKARENIRKKGLQAKVSVMQFSGAGLPYADNLVNLLLAGELGEVPMDEVMRVLTPGGAAIIGGKKTVKPWPKDIDDWSHFMHDASNNAVANDTRIGPPKRLKWVCGPLWARSHEFNSSTAAMISAGGRIFYIYDNGLLGVTDKPIPERWTLIARDAFNGLFLWDRPMPKWGTSQWKSKALRSVPKTVPRRIVSDGDRLFVTLEYTAPVSILDAASGKVLAVCEGSEGAQELRCSDGVILVRKGAGMVMGFDSVSGKKLWSVKAGNIQQLSLAALNGKVFYQSGAAVTCLDLKTGKQLWKTAGAQPVKKSAGKDAKPAKRRRRGGSSFVIAYGDRVVFNGPGGLQAVSADTGKTLWTGGGKLGSEPFIAGGQIWQRQGRGLAGIDLETGKPGKKIGAVDVFTEGHHPRCYQSKATVNYVITPNRGVEFVSLTGESNTVHDWTRGACTYGIMPGNGLLYVPPDPCFCYPGVKITGFHAMDAGDPLKPINTNRLVKGPAFGSPLNSKSKSNDWPTYRHDARRSGGTKCDVPPGLSQKWKVNIKGKLSPPVLAGKHLYIAAKEEHTIYALGASDGAVAWRFTADGPIDSPPSIHGDAVIFGSADGRVYCLRASDGALVWLFRAAPADRLIVNFGQLESAWRVHGSVLIVGDTAYCTAGRSTYLDGGIRLYALDIATGKVLHETCVDTWAKTRKDAEGKPFIPGYHMEGAFSDVLVSEGDFIFMGQYKFDRSLKQQPVPYAMLDRTKKSPAMGRQELTDKPYAHKMGTQLADETRQRNWQINAWKKRAAADKEKYGASNLGERTMGRHVFSTGGFLDASWYNRTFWMYSETWPGFHIANRGAKTGQLLTVDDKNTYAVQAYPRRNLQSPLFTPEDKGYLLFADDNDNEPIIPDYTRGVPKGIGFTRKDPPVWFKWVPLRIRAMTAAKNALFVAGAPDVLDPKDIMGAFEGRKGALLWAVSKTDGKKLAEYKLDYPPVFDGMIAADGKLFVVTIDGGVRCYGSRE
ncbi:MAG: PQQ-binding-like beta-propeller repeat protein [Phycisphaerales bacterium]|jgi:outer membrane protein assembly factor BamB|nr:PQQ-binding-like beta-propeller repeat protein [Phycisphaerales bacterium]